VRILFLASSAFALPSLRGLLGSPHTVAGVVSQPDRLRGRRGRVQPTPIAAQAEKAAIPVLKPEKIGSPDTVRRIREISPDAIVSLAYGQRVPAGVREGASLVALNLHPSLLPRHRGAAPIPWTILAGDPRTGVTAIEMVDQMDAGPILAQRTVPLAGTETAGDLEELLAAECRDLLLDCLERLNRGNLERREQDDRLATSAPILGKDAFRVDWSQSCEKADRQIRALSPRPGARSSLDGLEVKLLRTSPPLEEASQGAPGEIVALDDAGLRVAAGSGEVVLTRLQPENGKEMDVWSFARGRVLRPGQRLI